MEGSRTRFFRSYEYILLVFFAYTSILAVALPLPASVPRVTLAMNGVVAGGLILLAYADSFRRPLLLESLRDWYAPALVLLAYREMGWFAQPHPSTRLEHAWVVWDRLLLNHWGLKAMIESLGPALPSVLEISYTFVYAMAPFGLIMFYVYKRRERTEAFLFRFVLAVLTVYALFPLFPSEPPWTVFPGRDVPAYPTVFRSFNGFMLRSEGIHTSVFPSAHVASSITVALGLIALLPEEKWVGRLALALAISITLATVYGRYHYAADALAGLAIALAVALVGRWRERASR